MNLAYDSTGEGLFLGVTLAATNHGALAYLNILSAPSSTSFSGIKMNEVMTVTKVALS